MPMLRLDGPGLPMSERLYGRRSPRGRIGLRAGLALVLLLTAARPLDAADRLRDGSAAYEAHDYATAAKILLGLAWQGDPKAQTLVGQMHEKGYGLPQNFMAAAAWYRCAAGQAFPPAAYALGLLYDKGLGVPQDYVIAYAWLDFAVSAINEGRERYYWTTIRDAISSKLSLVDKLRAQEMALAGPEPNVCVPFGLPPVEDP